MFYTYSYTNIGKRRLINQDRLIVNGKTLAEDERHVSTFTDFLKGYVIIADGMGGTKEGEVAAQMIVDYFKNNDVEFDEIKLNIALLEINRDVVNYRNEHYEDETVGSTVVGLFTLNNEALVFNVGDSLMYSFENGSFTELSIAHNTYTYERKVGRQGLFKHPGGLLEFIGNSRPNVYFPYNFFIRRVNVGEIIFLSTDGVTNYYPNPESLAKIFAEEKNLEVCAQKIIDHVLEGGAIDNFSFAIITKTS